MHKTVSLFAFLLSSKKNVQVSDTTKAK